MPAEETPPLPPAADPPPREPTGADLPADSASPAPPVDAASPDSAGEAASGASSPAVRHRRRRRRRPPRGPGAAQEFAVPTPIPEAAAGAAGASDGGPYGEAAFGEGGAIDQPQGATDPAAPGERPAADAAIGRPRRHRRRRRPFGGFGTTPAPGALGSALPPAESGEAAPEGSDGALGGGSSRPTLHLRRPVRGRRQLPRPPGLQRGVGGAATEDGTSSQPDATSPGGAPESGDAAARAANEFPRRRRRRHPAPRGGEAVPSGEGQAAAPAQTTGRARPPRGRDRRDGMGAPREAGAPRDEAPQDRAPGRGRRDDAARAGGRGGREGRSRGPGGPRGRGREAPRAAEQKLYASEALVDRGFEDVPDEGEENGSRRVHWTIVKRSVADQKSGKAMSATYVLQREGGETEFANLGAARAAANKTIVHPEKLTMSKAEHAAEHAAAKNTR